MSRAQELIENLGLLPHPEGGHYKETYRSQASTAIYYLLERGSKSSLHRIKSDEVWHFYEGQGLTVVEILPSGKVRETQLSKECPQHVVSGGTWFGAYLPETSDYALVGCTVAPAFQYEDFEIGQKSELLKTYPEARLWIERLNS